MIRTGVVSFFFRDEKGLRRAIDNVSWQASPKIWSAGCSAGQEPFTIAMICTEKMNKWKFRNLKIYATDIVKKFGNRIQQGIYTNTEVNGIKENTVNYPLFKKYSEILDDGRYKIADEIKSRVTFIQHDVLREDPLSGEFDMITCKNVFEYFNIEEKLKVYNIFYKVLKPAGILVIDQKQRNVEFQAPEELFSRICKECVERIYRKR